MPAWVWWGLRWFGQLDFVGLPLTGIPPLPRASIGSHATCMSQTPPPDHDVVDLALDFADLSISIRGPPASAAAFVRNLSIASSEPSVVPPTLASRSVHSVAAGSEVSVNQASTSTSDSRAGLASSFPPVPQSWFRLSSRLGGSNLSAETRIQRAWTAGCWVKVVLQGRIGSPNRSVACSLANRYWVVVRCEGVQTPRIFTSSRKFFAAVGSVEGSSTLCHGFPSTTEAAIYLEAAGCDFPSSFD